MKKILFTFIVLLYTCNSMIHANPSESKIKLIQEGPSKYWCPITGMALEKYYKTSFTAKLQMNNTLRQYVSLGALVVDMQEYGLDMNSIQVYDMTSQDYIGVKEVSFVQNHKRKSPYIEPSFLAFSNKNEAKKFEKRNKGILYSFEEVLNQTQKDLSQKFLKVKHYYKKKVYPKGKRIYAKKCKDVSLELTDYIEINELKAHLHQTCKNLNESYLQAVALYLWDVQRKIELGEVEDAVKVQTHEKCPVCGMFTYKYPKWAAQIFYENKKNTHHHSFDGVKDMMKFYFEPMKWGAYSTSTQHSIKKVLVTDYYSQSGIEARSAFFVLGSDVYGPMGHELIPFESKKEAQTFKEDHRGEKIVTFDDITLEMIEALDEQ